MLWILLWVSVSTTSLGQDIIERGSGVVTNHYNLESLFLAEYSTQDEKRGLHEKYSSLEEGRKLDKRERQMCRATKFSTEDTQQNVCNKKDQGIKCIPRLKYRTLDGSCNNLQNPTWGKSKTCLPRLLPANFGKEQSTVRTAVSGKRLPNPRLIALALNIKYPVKKTHMALMAMEYGQFLMHDIMSRPMANESLKRVKCCPKSKDMIKDCIPISYPKNDPVYSKYGAFCTEFYPSDNGCDPCEKDSKNLEQFTTSFIDLSNLYGASRKESEMLRSSYGSLLSFFDFKVGEILPLKRNLAKDNCHLPKDLSYCFKAGDSQVNQHAILAAITIVFLRQHNRISTGLKELNPKWGTDDIFYETRRILGAQMQMITYNEFLPTLLGQTVAEDFKLLVRENEYTKYQSKVNPGIFHEFIFAAFRFGHTMVPSFYPEIPKTENQNGSLLKDLLHSPEGLYSGKLERYIRGLVSTQSVIKNAEKVPDISNLLASNKGGDRKPDILVLDIMRGRDNGVPGYVDYVKFCKGVNITKFPELDKLMPKEQRAIFEVLYKSVEDIDLYAGGLSEYACPNSILGPTFSCIIGLQFYHLKYGDRYFFEHGGEEGSFTPGQLETIKKTKFSKILCETTNIFKIQKNVMEMPSKKNPVLPCYEIPDIDLKEWSEAKYKKHKKETSIDLSVKVKKIEIPPTVGKHEVKEVVG